MLSVSMNCPFLNVPSNGYLSRCMKTNKKAHTENINEGTLKKWQFRGTDNIRHTRHRTETKYNTREKTKKMNNTDDQKNRLELKAYVFCVVLCCCWFCCKCCQCLWIVHSWMSLLFYLTVIYQDVCKNKSVNSIIKRHRQYWAHKTRDGKKDRT
jgi:hypothetical protein